LTSDVQDK